MLTANVRFQGDSDFQILSNHVYTAPPPPTQFYPYIPKPIEEAVLRAMAKDPNARFQTVEEFGAALERTEVTGPILAASPVAGLRTPPGPTPGAPPPPPPATPPRGATPNPGITTRMTPPQPSGAYA